MPEEMSFFIYILEQYAWYKNEKTGIVLQRWDSLNLTQRIIDNYWRYHSECLQNAFDDIDEMVEAAQNAR